MSCVFFVEKNIHGAWVVYGLGGVRQYYGYSKAEAIKRYKKEFSFFENQIERVNRQR